MKVSILTYHWEDNYGATMQAYATYKAIASLGHTPEFIDLRLPYNLPLKKKLVFALKRYRFNQFRRKYFRNLSERTYFSIEDLRKNPPQSNCYLVGSDQTWNPQINKSLLPAFFLTFGPDKIKRTSYATSIGLNEWEKSQYISDDEIRLAVSKFDKILLREDSAVKICKEIFDADARQVIDPVLLFRNYHELTGDLKYNNEIIAYKLIDDSGFYDKAKDVSLKLKMPIRSIGSVRRPSGFLASYPESLENWIKRIASASIVLTDSFHGTVFSLLYHRPFVVYIGDPARTTRLKSLLSQLNLGNRIVSSSSTSDDILKILSEQINWNEVDLILQNLRSDSLQQLKLTLS